MIRDKESIILITGAAGFIASCLARYLNNEGHKNLILVDDFNRPDKEYNWKGIACNAIVERDDLISWLNKNKPKISFFLHIGARTDTTEFDYSIHEKLNVQYSKEVWKYCTENNVPLIYASSAATYGAGEFGYSDDHAVVNRLKPLNPYGLSKNEFDKWVLTQKNAPPFWAGLKFFNVYGPGEYHKGRMASVIFHAYNQIEKNGAAKLFRSHRDDYKDGEQLRDFIYVKDICKVILWMMNSKVNPGLYNLGSGKARTFLDLVKSIYLALDKGPNIEFIDMPADIREKYQYFTEADMKKLRDANYLENFFSLENGVKDYVQNYLVDKKTF